jgi:methyl-accepting chemotaxis protein
MESPGLIISKEGKESVYKILNSNEWKEVLENFKIFTEKYATGEYNIDAKNFSSKITGRIEAVFKVIKSEQQLNLDVLTKSVKQAEKEFLFLASCLILVLVITVATAYVMIDKITLTLKNVSDALKKSIDSVKLASTQIAASSEELSQATIEQASSLQETSSSIEEINTMIQNTHENSKQAVEYSDSCLQASDRGKSVVGNMIKSINDISTNNQNVSTHLINTNNEIGNILHIISEIAKKTQVINEIVFQTKLLSFNASVEAARAGEAGKGFAVVAEEVGNLAQMSGKAAIEITNLIDQSTLSVEAIVKNSDQKINELIKTSKVIVSSGVNSAHECEGVFNEIATSLTNVSSMMSSIMSAGQEQTLGVQEVTKAIAQLDHISQLNSANSSSSAVAANSLALEAEALNSLGEKLVVIINGAH